MSNAVPLFKDTLEMKQVYGGQTQAVRTHVKVEKALTWKYQQNISSELKKEVK